MATTRLIRAAVRTLYVNVWITRMDAFGALPVCDPGPLSSPDISPALIENVPAHAQ